MPLYIHDDEVDDLVVTLMRVTGAKTKTEAVRQALEFALAHQPDQASLSDRIRPLQSRVAALGAVDPGFDMKAFSDDL